MAGLPAGWRNPTETAGSEGTRCFPWGKAGTIFAHPFEAANSLLETWLPCIKALKGGFFCVPVWGIVSPCPLPVCRWCSWESSRSVCWCQRDFCCGWVCQEYGFAFDTWVTGRCGKTRMIQPTCLGEGNVFNPKPGKHYRASFAKEF